MKNILIFISLIFIVTSCASKSNNGSYYYVYGKKYHTLKRVKKFSQKGIASWYGKKFHGRKTSNGETYNMYAMTCAHKTLPFNTRLKVKNLSNGRTTIVRVNDRGPFVKNRIIDLSYSAAKKIGVDITGTAPVIIESIDDIHDESEIFTVQVGAFGERANAFALKKKLEKEFEEIFIKKVSSSGKIFYRVRVGRFNSIKSAERAESRLVRLGYGNVMITALD